LSVLSSTAARFTVRVREGVVAFTLALALPVLALTVLFAVLAATFTLVVAGFFGGIAREGSLYGERLQMRDDVVVLTVMWRVCEF
jgi:uncharacterized membrane protein